MEKITSYKKFLAGPVSVRPLALFRIFFGSLMAWYVFQYRSDAIIYTHYLAPGCLFSFPLLGWLHFGVLPESYLYLLFKVMLISAVCVAVGFLYRSALLIFLATFSYAFLLEKTLYNNHYYFIILISFLMLFVPANGMWSVDTYLEWAPRRKTTQQWRGFLLQMQVILVYFFGGLAKLGPDWMSTAVIRTTFAGYPSWAVLLLTYGGVITDFGVAALLFSRRYRMAGIIWAVAFQSLIKINIGVGIFPFLMMAVLILFVPVAPRDEFEEKPLSPKTFGWIHLYLVLQCLLPFQHLLYPGNVNWTKEGDYFSWRMFSQKAVGHLDVYLTDRKTGKKMEVPRLKGITLASYAQMVTRPKMIWQYAHYLKKVYEREGMHDPVVNVDSFVALNGRNFYRLIDPHVDLGRVAYPFWHHARWILPHPDKQPKGTGVAWYNVGAFFKPAYQLAVIDAEALVPGDDPTYHRDADMLKRIAARYKLPEQKAADKIVLLRQAMWQKGGPLVRVEEMLQFMEKTQASTFSELLDKVARKYVLLW